MVVSAEPYVHQVKPTSMETTKEVCYGRQHVCQGALTVAWSQRIGAVAVQCAVQEAATVSVSQAAVASATVQNMLDANKSLRLLKLTGDVDMVLGALGRVLGCELCCEGIT